MDSKGAQQVQISIRLKVPLSLGYSLSIAKMFFFVCVFCRAERLVLFEVGFGLIILKIITVFNFVFSLNKIDIKCTMHCWLNAVTPQNKIINKVPWW